MAGIGWRLERLIDRETISGAAAAYATGAAVMALPWALTSAALVALPLIVGGEPGGFGAVGTVVAIAYSVALLVDGPVQIVVARYTSDRLYEGRLRAIAAPLCRGLSAVVLVGALITAVVLRGRGSPPEVVLFGAALAAIAGALWTALSVGNGLCSPWLVLGAVTAGLALSLFLAPLLVTVAGLGAPGFLFALTAGQGLALAMLLVAILRALPQGVDEGARLFPAFREYAGLAGAGLAFNASLWVDRFLVAFLADGRTRSFHAAASTLAWFSTIPCLAWIFVEVETAFHRTLREFYRDLEGGAPLAQVRAGARRVACATARLLRGAAMIQAGVTLFLEAAAASWAHLLHLPEEGVLPYRYLLLSAGLQALALLGLIVLYHFDLRRDALISASTLLGAIAFCTAAAPAAGLPPGAGTALGCAAGTVLTWVLVRRGVTSLLGNTLLREPFGTEALADPGPKILLSNSPPCH
jgi:uncharacterized membrane protein